jgi:hypothetical protein
VLLNTNKTGEIMENLKTAEKNLILSIPAVNLGEFRFKFRKSNLDFGNSFPTRTEKFNENIYLEWLIGYDATVTDVKNGKKQTGFKKKKFTGSNGKEKYLSELSEIVLETGKIGLLKKKDIEDLEKEITAYKEFMERDITVTKGKKISMNGINFSEAVVALPTFIMEETSDSTQIETSMEKQQYAAGVQPMIYFCIPLKCFSNYKSILGRSSIKNDVLEYVIDTKSVNNFKFLMRIFGMASKKHRHDILEIIKIIKGEL